MTPRSTTIQVRVTPDEKQRLQGLADEHTKGSVSDLLRNRALGIADVAAPNQGYEGSPDPRAGLAPLNGSGPSRADRVAQRTRELRDQGVSTYAAMDQARDEIAAEDRHE